MLTVERTKDALKSKGMRVTAQRLAVAQVLEHNTSHPTVDEISREVIRQVPTMSLSTVYKTLGEFADLGLVTKVQTGDVTRFDPDVSDHAHALCSECGKVLDIRIPGEMVAQLKNLGADQFREVQGVSIHYVGTCSYCK